MLSNEDGINLVGPLARQLATVAFLPEQPEPSTKDTTQVRSILEALRNGKIDRTLFTANANSYFSETALRDCKASMAPLGALKNVTVSNENLRGGMTHRSYRAEFDKKTLLLNIYIMPDGKFEQFMIEDQL